MHVLWGLQYMLADFVVLCDVDYRNVLSNFAIEIANFLGQFHSCDKSGGGAFTTNL